MKEIVDFAKSFADPTRVRILNTLRQSELCVCELIDILEIGQSTLSTHLQTLRNAGIVATEKRRTWIIYRIDENAQDAVNAIFEHFPPSNVRIARDEQRLARRIDLRVEGCCVRGSGALDQREIAHA